MLVGQRYRLGDPIGRGGMGQVWHAVDEVLGREVAVKLLHPGSASDVAAARFRLEAQAAARINDPHVVAVYDFGVDADRLFLVLELIDGCSLADELHRHGALPPTRAADVIAQTARGLASAHGHGVVHRDIKPANLLLATPEAGSGGRLDRIDSATSVDTSAVDDTDWLVKIADFGIARIADSAAALTATGQIAGTSYYLAPERAIGEPGGPEADVYSLGCVGYHMVTGRPPFHGDAPAAIAFQHVDSQPVRPGDLCPQVPGDLEDMLLRMLAKDPVQRPSADEVADWMSTPGQGRLSGPLLVAGSPSDRGDSGTDTQSIEPAEQGSRERTRPARRVTYAAVASAVVVGGAMTWTAPRSGTEAERPNPNAPTTVKPTQDRQSTTSPASRSSTQPRTGTSSKLPPGAGHPTTISTAAAEPSTGLSNPTGAPSSTGPTTSSTSTAPSVPQSNPTTPDPSPTDQDTPSETTPVPTPPPTQTEPTTPAATPP